MTSATLIKSPLRYPGGKSKAVNMIAQYLPSKMTEFRESFCGGASMSLWVRQKYPDCQVWMNDLNTDLYSFWYCCQKGNDELVAQIWEYKEKYQNRGSELFLELMDQDVNKLSLLDRGIRFFILNRITYSGTTESGGYSQMSFDTRFTESSIYRVQAMEHLLSENVSITNADYTVTFREPCKDAFIFLDPPYYSQSKSRLYGKKGDLHTSFDHNKFAEFLKDQKCNWLATYDDCQVIRDKFNWAKVIDWQLQYSMNNQARDRVSKGAELFIKPQLQVSQVVGK